MFVEIVVAAALDLYIPLVSLAAGLAVVETGLTPEEPQCPECLSGQCGATLTTMTRKSG